MERARVPRNPSCDNNLEEQDPPMDRGQGLIVTIHLLTEVLRQQQQ